MRRALVIGIAAALAAAAQQPASQPAKPPASETVRSQKVQPQPINVPIPTALPELQAMVITACTSFGGYPKVVLAPDGTVTLLVAPEPEHPSK
jgi:hypothetical protein